MFAAFPVRNPDLRARETDGKLCVTVPRRKTPWVRFLKLVFQIPMEKEVELDKNGTWFVKLCDGKRSVDRIIREVARQKQLEFKESEMITTAYLRTLAEKGIVGFMIKGNG